MIHLLDSDTRQFTDKENYPFNHGSLSSVIINLNKSLKKLGYYSEPDEAEWVGTCDGLNSGFKYKDKKNFLITCWETANTIPEYVLNSALLSNQKLIGMSNQITNLWTKYGFECETLHLGIDTEFWQPSVEKNKDVFTFICPFAIFSRSAIDLTLEAFYLAFKDSKDVILKLKDTESSQKYIEKINQYKKLGANIEHISNRVPMQWLRDFYSSAHVCLSLQRAASFGLIITETMACNTLNITGNIPPSNEIVNSDVGILVNPNQLISIPKTVDYFVNEWGFINTYGNLSCPEEPYFYDFSVEEYAQKMQEAYQNWTTKYSKINYRNYIYNNFSWDNSAKKLIKILTNKTI